MAATPLEFSTPTHMLVEVAKIAAPFKGRPDGLGQVATEVGQLVPILSYDVAAVIAREMDLNLSDVYNFITFYAMLSTKAHGKYTIRMCKSISCHVNGSADVIRTVTELLHISPGETTDDGRFTLELVPCLGLCDSAPSMMINKKVYGNLTPESVSAIIKNYIREDVEE